MLTLFRVSLQAAPVAPRSFFVMTHLMEYSVAASNESHHTRRSVLRRIRNESTRLNHFAVYDVPRRVT
jgi:hypothetical protein